MIRAILILLLATPSAALAHGNPHHWPQYQEAESIVTIAPLGVWINEQDETRD